MENKRVLVTGAAGFTYAEFGSARLVARTDIPSDYSKPAVHVVPEPETIRNVPPGDTMPVGYVAVAPDGRRFVFTRPQNESGRVAMNVVLNWFDQLRAAPSGR